MKGLRVEELKIPPLQDRGFEITERKGQLHPDTMCDNIMNSFSIDLSQIYLNRTGRIHHHNLDKGLLAGGEVSVSFGGGRVEKPIKVIFGDRATFKVGVEEFDIESIGRASALKWIKANSRYLEPENFEFQSEIHRGSNALQDIFARDKKTVYLGSNDTSAAIGYAPYSPQERLVIDIERHFNHPAFKKDFPWSGEDVKIMASRMGDEVDLTIAMAFVAQHVKSERDYFTKKNDVLIDSMAWVEEYTQNAYNVNIHINTADKKNRGENGCYLTVTGTSLEAGDSGQVGRGNNVKGVIALQRPMSSEAASGKNPVSHIGKIYNFFCYHLAEEIHRELGFKEVYVWLLNRIGNPINNPTAINVQYIDDKYKPEAVKGQVDEVIAYEFDRLDDFCSKLAKGEVKVN